jgi:hypothetical protein
MFYIGGNSRWMVITSLAPLGEGVFMIPFTAIIIITRIGMAAISNGHDNTII